MTESKGRLYKNDSQARSLLSSSKFVPATALILAADMLTEGGLFAWEYETLFDELEDMKCLPSDSNRDKIMAGIAALNNPQFLWSAWVFKSTAQSFNGKVAAVEIMEELSPAKLVYCIDEINSLYRLYQGAEDMTPLYSDQPKIYLAGCCYSHGLINLPAELRFCDQIFKRFSNNTAELKNEVVNTLESRKHQEIDAYCTSLNTIRKSMLDSLT